MEVIEKFDPVKYSIEENKFLFSHAGEPPVVALRDLPERVNLRAVKPILTRIYELIELAKHEKTEWLGVEKIKQAITTYLAQQDKWLKDRKRGAPRFPSMHSFDSKKRAHFQGPGSDSGQVHTYFDEKGERHEFAVPLLGTDEVTWVPDWAKGPTDVPTDKTGIWVDSPNNRFECFCGHTESFGPDSRSSYNSARARMSKHLRSAKDEVDRHREIHTNEFGS